MKAQMLSATGIPRRRIAAVIAAALASVTVVAALVVAGSAPARQSLSRDTRWQLAGERQAAGQRQPAGRRLAGQRQLAGRRFTGGHSHLTLGAPRRARPPGDPSGGFLFRDGRFASLRAVPGAAVTGHINVNNRGQMVGGYIDAAGTVRSFVEDRRGRVVTFAVPGAGTYFEAGETLGGAPAPGKVHGFVRQPGGRITTIDLPAPFTATAVTDLNDRGQTAGQAADAGGRIVGFLREPGGRVSIIELPGGAGVQEYLTLNDRGQVAGTWDDRYDTPAKEPNSSHGFVWYRGRVTRFDVPGSVATGVLGINNEGQITGSYDDAGGHHGFLLRRGRYTRIDAPGRTATDAWGVNDRGDIVIPEPGTGLTPVTR